jgi:hypothetical protein
MYATVAYFKVAAVLAFFTKTEENLKESHSIWPPDREEYPKPNKEAGHFKVFLPNGQYVLVHNAVY